MFTGNLNFRSSSGGDTMASTLEEQQRLQECMDYIASNSIQNLLKDCIVKLCITRPDDPVIFLRKYFQKLERVSGERGNHNNI